MAIRRPTAPAAPTGGNGALAAGKGSVRSGAGSSATVKTSLMGMGKEGALSGAVLHVLRGAGAVHNRIVSFV